MTYDRFFIALFMLAAALWLRQRARKLLPEQRKKALIGLLAFLLPALLLLRFAVDRFKIGRYENLAIEVVGLTAIFAIMAFVFVKPEKQEGGV